GRAAAGGGGVGGDPEEVASGRRRLRVETAHVVDGEPADHVAEGDEPVADHRRVVHHGHAEGRGSIRGERRQQREVGRIRRRELRIVADVRRILRVEEAARPAVDRGRQRGRRDRRDRGGGGRDRRSVVEGEG